MVAEKLRYEDLYVSALKSLISYVFQSQKQTGASKHNTTKAACLEFLATVDAIKLKGLLDKPPHEPAAPTATPLALVDATPVVTAEPLALSMSSALALDIDPPDNMLVQAQPPDWLQAALAAQSDTASRMVGLFIAYKWPARIGGWLMGKVIKVNKQGSDQNHRQLGRKFRSLL